MSSDLCSGNLNVSKVPNSHFGEMREDTPGFCGWIEVKVKLRKHVIPAEESM
jgi:hypothetical protein